VPDPHEPAAKDDVSVLDENKELVRRYTREVFDEGDVGAVDRYLASDFFNHVTGKSGTDDFKLLAREVGQAEGTANAIEFMVAEGDLVVAYMTITRTLHEELDAFGLTLAADGRSYTVTHVHIYRVVEGKIREHWAVRDDLSMLRQLGALPSAGLAEASRSRSASRPVHAREPEAARFSGVSELALLVDDLERAEAFYAGVVGLPVVERWKDAVWLIVGARTRIGLWLASVEPLAGERAGSHVHFALHIHEAHLDDLVRDLERANHSVHVEVFSDGRGRAAYVTDPDGHTVEFWTWDVAGHLPVDAEHG
jgi:predicted ester cyclase/catechol 2,3-dioxygenase-like lactoylglutathione lyase family enzyme